MIMLWNWEDGEGRGVGCHNGSTTGRARGRRRLECGTVMYWVPALGSRCGWTGMYRGPSKDPSTKKE